MKTRLLRLLPFATLLFALALSGCTESAAECPDTNEVCGGQCTNTQIDRTNCGGCGNVCATGFQCIEGGCACPAGEVACGGTCVRIENDGRNCGGCGNVCDAGEICTDGVCGEGACPGLLCDVDGEETCIADADTNEQHCGACGNVCGEGTSCMGGVCTVGDLYATCFNGGTVVPLLKETNTETAPKATLIDGPQSLTLYADRYLLLIGGVDQTFYVIDRASMLQVGSVQVGVVPNDIVVRDDKAYVVSSMENSVAVIDLSDPSAPRITDEVSLGAGTNPYLAAFDADGVLWVTLYMTDKVGRIDFTGNRGVALDPVTLPTEGLEGTPLPAGVAAVGGTVYVTLNNLDTGGDWDPAGHGRLAAVSRSGGDHVLHDLGESCTNPGAIAVDGTELYISCTASYWNGEVAVFDTTTDEVTRRIATGKGPAGVSLDPSRPGYLYIADNAGLGPIAVDPDGSMESIDVCTVPEEIGWEYNTSVLVTR